MDVPLRSRLRACVDVWRARTGRKNLSTGNNLLILAYHRVLPIEDAQRFGIQPGMFVTPETLRMQISLLRKYVDLVHLDDWVLNDKGSTTNERTKCAITFDDGWRDNFDIAYPILKEFECPATIFLATGYIGTARKFWPERISALLSDWAKLESNPPAFREMSNFLARRGVANRATTLADINEVIEDLKKKDDRTICRTLDAIEQLLRDDNDSLNNLVDLMDWDQVRIMADSGLVRFGSHTVEHLRLSEQISDSRAVEELDRSRIEIREKTGREPRVFCYPNGDYSERILNLVGRYYAAACTINKGWVDPDNDPLLLPRICLNEGGSNQVRSFLARLA